MKGGRVKSKPLLGMGSFTCRLSQIALDWRRFEFDIDKPPVCSAATNAVLLRMKVEEWRSTLLRQHVGSKTTAGEGCQLMLSGWIAEHPAVRFIISHFLLAITITWNRHLFNVLRLFVRTRNMLKFTIYDATMEGLTSIQLSRPKPICFGLKARPLEVTFVGGCSDPCTLDPFR